MQIYGKTIDDQTRCVHYATPVDVIAIKFACCLRYYPCHLCHAETADHSAVQWPLDKRSERAVLCGVCRAELTIDEYLAVEECPYCQAAFNERCRLHTHLYFQVP